jgi:hypothetical protein
MGFNQNHIKKLVAAVSFRRARRAGVEVMEVK